jgi:signal transduction histidine kinase
VDPGETRWGQQVVLLMENPRDALPRWAGWTGKSHHARAASPPLTGWGTWYSFGNQVTGEDVLAVVETVRKNPDRLRPDVILTDKGHGVPERFPESQAFYSRAIAATGARPGLKLEFDGKVDPYAYIRRVVRDGVSFVKLGDIRGPGDVRDPKQTDFEMRRSQYAAAREAAGPDTYLLNCRLFLDRASVGYVDASRTGRMTWNYQMLPAINEVLRSYHLNGRWFAIDNDHFYLGTDDANVSRIAGGWPVARTWMSMVGMSCGAAFASDPLNLASVKPFWRNLEVMTPPAREQTEVLDLGTFWRMPRLVGQVRREWGDATIALLWNPEDKENTIKLDFPVAGMDGKKRYAVWSYWENRYLGLAQEFWNTPRLAPSASQHLRFTPIPADFKPVLIGSNLHIYCGAAEIKAIRSTRSSMAIELTDAGARAGDLFVYSHYLPVLRSASGLAVTDIDQAGENVWRIRMRDRKHGAAQRIELSILLPVTRQWWFWSLIGLVIAGFLTTVWRYLISLRLERRLALDQERSRISRDLHDGMGADLTQIALIAEMAARQPGLLPAAREQLDRIVASTHNLAGELDSVVWATNPGNDTLEHLVQYLGNYAQLFLEVAAIRLRLDVSPQLPDLAVSSATRHDLFLAAKEALHNVVRHAGATCVTLRVRIQDHTLVVEVEDDGRGLAARATPAPGADGLPNMANRMARIQGRCETLPGKDGRGTLVRFSLPLRELDSPSQS